MSGGRLVDPFGRAFHYDATAYLRERNRREARRERQEKAGKFGGVSDPRAEAYHNPA